MILEVTEALPVSPATSVYYLIYFGSDFNTFRNSPVLLSTEIPVSVPESVFSDPEQFWAVAAAQLGVSGDLSSPNLGLASADNSSLFVLPESTSLRAALGVLDTHVLVNDISGFPAEDGYLLVGSEIIHYSATEAIFLGGPSFSIQQRGMFGTTAQNHASGAAVSLYLGEQTAVGTGTKGIASCGLRLPEWVSFERVGIESVTDVGNGIEARLTWYPATVPSGFSQPHYNIYRASDRGQLYTGTPLAFSTGLFGTVVNLTPRDGYYYGVKAAYHLANIPTTGLSEFSTGLFEFPSPTSLTGALSIGSLGSIGVASTAGFPTSGLLKIGAEIAQYNSKTATTFNLVARDVFKIGNPTNQAVGAAIEFFKGVEDGNTYFFRLTTSWDGYGVGALPLVPGDGYWGFEYLQDPDGYRNFPQDNINEDHQIQEADGEEAQPFDFCGIRSTNPVDFFNQNYCGGTYHGNTSRGIGGGINAFETNIQRQEIILSVTGDQFILLRRRWTGRVCRRISHRNEHPHARCSLCYGSSFEGGFDRYIHPREIRPGEPNPNGFIAARVSPYNDEVGLVESRGLTAEATDMSIWTLAIPTIRDRDVLIRYKFDIETGRTFEEFRYEVITVQRNVLLLGKDGAQHITLKRLNKTDEIYKFPVPLV
jgi:hypothetical protein